MATQKLQANRALTVIPSDNSDIPSVNLLVQSETTGSSVNRLIDINAEFIVGTVDSPQYKVNAGDIVYCYNLDGANVTATIISVISSSELELNWDMFNGNDGVPYFIYQAGSQTGFGNQGCVLYIGNGGSLKVLTSGNDIVTLFNTQGGTFYLSKY